MKESKMPEKLLNVLASTTTALSLKHISIDRSDNGYMHCVYTDRRITFEHIDRYEAPLIFSH